jgi:rhamnose transport system ATP-binding protein
MTDRCLQLVEVTKSFGEVRALRGVSFDLRPGEVHALLGENGAGKSTLIKIITGAYQPDVGTIEINGELVRHLTPAAARQLGVACIYQAPSLFPDLSVAENIALRLESGAAVRRIDWRARRRRAEQLLEKIGAHISPEAEAGRLSMAEQQLVEIACVIGAAARIVIMDEPTASLTGAEQKLLFKIVREMQASGAGVIYISHRLEEICQVADRVTVLRDGQSVGTRPIKAAANTTSTAGAVSEAELIRLMVGREVSQLYPPAEGQPGDVVLSLQNVGCAESGLHEITLEIRAGEILGLAGLVGAGRTELARVLFGIAPADAGKIFIDGAPIEAHSPSHAIARGIGFVPEDRRRYGVILDLSVAANVTMAIHGRVFPQGWLRPGDEQELAREYIQKLDIRTSGPAAAVRWLSGGNQQKVALARWLAIHPRLLILDEPTQGVDVGAKSEIHKIMRQLAREGMAILLISSDLPEIVGMSDRVAVMRGGTIVATLPGPSDAAEVMAAALGQRGGAT